MGQKPIDFFKKIFFGESKVAFFLVFFLKNLSQLGLTIPTNDPGLASG
jgi:hypothetical protein